MMDTAELKAGIRHARGQFAAMAAAYALGAFNDNFYKQAACLLAIGAGKADLQGWATVLFSLPFILLAAPAGWLADRFPKRNVVIGSKVLELAAMICGAIGICAGSWPLILLMVMTMGAQSAIFSPSLNGSIPELYPLQYVPTANGIVKMVVTAAILLGVAMAGLALNVRGQVAGIDAGRAVVACGVLAVAAVGLIGSLGVPRRPAAAPAAAFPWTGPVDTVKVFAQIVRDRPLLVVLAVDVYLWFAGALVVLLVNLLGKAQLGLGDAMTSALVGAELTGVAVGGLLAGWLARGAGWWRILVHSAGGMGAALILVLAAAEGLPPAWRSEALMILLGLAGLAGGLMLIPCESFIQVRPPAERRGTVIAAANCAAFVGIMLAGPTANGMYRAMQPATALAAVGGATTLVAAALAIILRRGKLA